MKMKSIVKRTGLAVTLAGLFYSLGAATAPLEAQEKSEATIELSYYKKADLTKTAVAIVKVRKDNKFVPAKNERVNFYALKDKEPQFINSANTNNKGQAEILLPNDLPLDEELFFTIVAKFENNSLYEKAEEQVRYQNANLAINMNPHDTARLVTAKVTEIGKDGKEVPVKGAELKFYIQRLFGFMPATEDNAITTDEKGEASFAFPKNIPGDSAGVVFVSARMEDNQRFGNVESNAPTFWGTKLATERDPFPRALWEPYAPLPLVLTISSIFGGVWFTYVIILLQLRKIKKDEELAIKS
jgi:hypothetical protein